MTASHLPVSFKADSFWSVPVKFDEGSEFPSVFKSCCLFDVIQLASCMNRYKVTYIFKTIQYLLVMAFTTSLLGGSLVL